MFNRRWIPALIAAPLLAALTPRPASACTPASGFVLERSYPAADATGAPRDLHIVAVGQGEPGPSISISVSQGGAPVAGSVAPNFSGHHSWTPAETLAPDTEYDVHIVSEDPFTEPQVVTHDFSFTTGAALAGESAPPTVNSATLEVFEREIKACAVEAEPGSCIDCAEYEVVGVEQRLRLIVDVEQPDGPFAGFLGSAVRWGASEEVAQGPRFAYQGAEAGPTHHVIDLGPVAEWPGEQVCLRVSGSSPIDAEIDAVGQPSCLEIGELKETLTSDDDRERMGCRAGDAPAGPLAALVLGLALLRRRRAGST